jgi:hypothetical protein
LGDFFVASSSGERGASPAADEWIEVGRQEMGTPAEEATSSV